MRAQTKITYNLKGLEELRAQIGNKYVARVGILGGAGLHKNHEVFTSGGKKYLKVTDSAGNISNAALGLIHEFGSVSRNIPARSFLRMPIATQGKEITKLMSGQMVKDAVEKGDIKKVYKILGVIGERIVDNAFSTAGFGSWPALKPATIAAKGSDAPLIDTAQLRRSITSDVKLRSEING